MQSHFLFQLLNINILYQRKRSLSLTILLSLLIPLAASTNASTMILCKIAVRE